MTAWEQMALVAVINTAPLRFVLMQYLPQFPGGSLPLDVQGPLEMKHVVNGSVGIDLELQQVHWGTGTSAAVNGSYQGYVSWDSL